MDDLIDPILCLALRIQSNATLHPWHHSAIPQGVLAILNTTHPDLSRQATRALLTCTWWVSADLASAMASPAVRFRLLNDMLLLNQHPRMRRPIEADESGLDSPVRCGDIKVLDWWVRAGLIRDPVGDLKRVPGIASAAGQVQVLDWWAEQTGGPGASGKTDVIKQAMVEASRHGHIAVLDWWAVTVQANKELLHDAFADALAAAAASGHVHVLQWWMEQLGRVDEEVMFQVQAAALRQGTIHGHVHMLEFGREIDPQAAGRHCTASAIDQASGHGHLLVLDWWWLKMAEQNRAFPFQDPLTRALQQRNLAVWKWWTNPTKQIPLRRMLTAASLATICDGPDSSALVSILELISASPDLIRYNNGRMFFKSDATDALARHGHIDALHWIVARKIKFALSKHFADIASEFGHVAVLDWWRANAPSPLQYSAQAVDHASGNGFICVLEWWDNQKDLRFKWTRHSLRQAALHGQKPVLEWWLAQIETGRRRLRRQLSPSTMAWSLTVSDKVDTDFIDWWSKASKAWYQTCHNGVYGSVLAKDSLAKFAYWYATKRRLTTHGERPLSIYLLQYGKLMVLEAYRKVSRFDPPRERSVETALACGSARGRLGTNLWLVQNGFEQFQFLTHS